MAMGELRELRPADAGADGGRGDTLDDLVVTEEVRYQLASPTFTGALSLFVWGLGQFYNGQMRAAKVFFAAQACLALYLYDFFSGGDVSTTVMSWTSPWVYGFFMTLLVGGGILVWLYNVYDAWATARFCHMIFDRTLPSLDDEEEELLAAHLRTTTFGVEHHRGAGRKMAYGALAVLAYSAVLFMLGSYFNGVGRGDLTALRVRLEANPTDAFSHLQLGELLMADGRYAEAVHAFNQVVRHSQDPSWSMVAYGNLARLYRRLGDDERAKEMLARAATMGAATAVAATPPVSVQESTPAPPDASIGPGEPSGAGDVPPSADTNAATLAFALETARADLEAGALDGALSTLNGLEARGIEAPSALALKARVHLARGDVAAAKACVDAALADDADSIEVQGARLALACAENDAAAVSAAWVGFRSAGGNDASLAARAASVLNDASSGDAAYRLVAEALTAAPRDPGLLKLSFTLARDAGNEAQAYEAALALVEAQVRDVAAYGFLADGAARRGDLDAAVKYARGLTVLEPGTARWLVLLGDLEGRRGAVAEATTAYRNALVLDDRQVEVYRKLAALAAGSKAWNDAALYLNRAIAMAPGDVGLLKDLADVHRRRGALDEALAALDAARRLDPQDLDVKYSTGVVRFERDDAAAAAGILGEVFAVAPSYREVAWFYGRCCEREGRRDEALRAYGAVRPGSEYAAEAARRAAALTPAPPTPAPTAAATSRPVLEDPVPTSPPLATAGTAAFVPVERYADLLRRAELAAREDRFDEALGLYDQVLALVPTHARSLYQRGVVLRQLGRTGEAVTALQAARRARPDDMTVLIELGNLLADLGRLDEATEAFETAVRIDPKHLAARYTLGWLFEKRGNYAKAEEHYKAIAWFYPEYVKAYEYLGNVYFVQAKYAEALTNFDKILALDPDDTAVRFKAALTLLNINDVDRARRELLFLKGALGPEHPLRAKVVQYLAKLG